MIPKGAINTPPPTSGPHRVYLPRVHRETIYWALWDVERQLWTLPYGGSRVNIQPSFESMEKLGHLKWSAPGVMLHWLPSDDEGSDAHLARAIGSAA